MTTPVSTWITFRSSTCHTTVSFAPSKILLATHGSYGFELNPYDPYVANKIVDGAQLTVVWHFDALKVSHVDAGVVTQISVWLQKTYERLFDDGLGAIKLKRGKYANIWVCNSILPLQEK